MSKNNRGSNIAGTAVILAILALVLMQAVSFLISAYSGTQPLALGVPLSMFIVLLMILLPYKYLFEAPLTSGKSLAVTAIAVTLVIIFMWAFPRIVPQIFENSFSIIKMSVLP